MTLVDTIGQYVPFLARKASLPREQMLALRPVRSTLIVAEPIAPEDDGGPERLALRVPGRSDSMGRVLARLLSLPNERRIELDEFGSAIWEQCDGTRTVDHLVRFTCETYKLNRRQAEVSVVAFMRMLAQRRLIGLARPEEKQNNARPIKSTQPAKQKPQAGRARRRRF